MVFDVVQKVWGPHEVCDLRRPNLVSFHYR